MSWVTEALANESLGGRPLGRDGVKRGSGYERPLLGRKDLEATTIGKREGGKSETIRVEYGNRASRIINVSWSEGI